MKYLKNIYISSTISRLLNPTDKVQGASRCKSDGDYANVDASENRKESKSYHVDAEEETLEEVLGDSAFQEKPLVMDR